MTYGVSGRFMNTCRRGEPLGNAEHSIRLADREVTAGYLAAGQEFFAAVAVNELQRREIAAGVAQRYDKPSVIYASTVRFDSLCT